MLSISNLQVYCNDKTILNNINLEIKKGEILGIVGESGCGKSTLLKTIMGLNSNDLVVTKGEIVYNNNNLLKLYENEFRSLRGKELAMVFQNAEATFCPVRTIESQFLEVIQTHKKVSKKQSLEMIEDIFNIMNLKDIKRVLKSYSFELSGGMNQRVAIAMSLILKPKLLLADEPTSSLDVTTQKKVIDEMIKVCKQLGTSIIIVSHNKAVVKYMANSIITMKDGKIIGNLKNR